jgi:hypothetical protein
MSHMGQRAVPRPHPFGYTGSPDCGGVFATRPGGGRRYEERTVVRLPFARSSVTQHRVQVIPAGRVVRAST